jgi:hypothetical protein
MIVTYDNIMVLRLVHLYMEQRNFAEEGSSESSILLINLTRDSELRDPGCCWSAGLYS